MGTVNFNTQVNKNVVIDKTVNVDVDKNATTNVDLNGSLASAEGSADATGGTGTGGAGGFTVRNFLIDGYGDDDIVEVGGLNPDVNSSAVSPLLDTDIPGTVTRVNSLALLSPEAIAFTTTNISVTSFATRDNGAQATSNGALTYNSDAEPYSVVVAGFDAANLADPFNRIQIENLSFDPGIDAAGNDATLRLSVYAEDADGDEVVASLVVTQEIAAALGVDVNVPLGALAGNVAIGTDVSGGAGVLFRGAADVDGGDSGVLGFDLTRIVNLQAFFEDDPREGTPNSLLPPGGTDQFFTFNTAGVAEVVSEDGNDFAEDAIRIITREPGDDDDLFHLAETETFAQVSEDGAFSFSDALAASSFQPADTLL